MEIPINPNLSHHIQVIEAIGKPLPFLLIPNYATIYSLSQPQSALKVYPFPYKRPNAKLIDISDSCLTGPFARKGLSHTNQ